MGFQGRAGPPGPPGLGEHGPPVSKEEYNVVANFGILYICFCGVHVR